MSSKDGRVRWGIISTANIGMEKVTPGIQRSPHSVVTAIASRDLARAKAAAKRLGIPKAYGSYEELLADGEVKRLDSFLSFIRGHVRSPFERENGRGLPTGSHTRNGPGESQA